MNGFCLGRAIAMWQWLAVVMLVRQPPNIATSVKVEWRQVHNAQSTPNAISWVAAYAVPDNFSVFLTTLPYQRTGSYAKEESVETDTLEWHAAVEVCIELQMRELFKLLLERDYLCFWERRIYQDLRIQNKGIIKGFLILLLLRTVALSQENRCAYSSFPSLLMLVEAKAGEDAPECVLV